MHLNPGGPFCIFNKSPLCQPPYCGGTPWPNKVECLALECLFCSSASLQAWRDVFVSISHVRLQSIGFEGNIVSSSSWSTQYRRIICTCMKLSGESLSPGQKHCGAWTPWDSRELFWSVFQGTQGLRENRVNGYRKSSDIRVPPWKPLPAWFMKDIWTILLDFFPILRPITKTGSLLFIPSLYFLKHSTIYRTAVIYDICINIFSS